MSLVLLRPQPESCDHHPLFIYLPGMDGSGQLLRSQIPHLSDCFDIRCLSIPLQDQSDWEMLTQRVIHLIQSQLDQTPNRRVYLCGESFGGCLAMKVACQLPQLFHRLILINPASSWFAGWLVGLAAQITRWVPDEWHPLTSKGLLPFLANLERMDPDDRQILQDILHAIPRQTSIWRLSLLSQFSILESRLRQLTQPALLIASTGDRLLPSLAEAERLSQLLPNARLVKLPGSGHASLLEKEVNLHQILKHHNFLPDSAWGNPG